MAVSTSLPTSLCLVTTVLVMLVAQTLCGRADVTSFVNSGHHSSNKSECPAGKLEYTKGESYYHGGNAKVYAAKGDGSDFVVKESHKAARRFVRDESTTELSIMKAVSTCPGVLHSLEDNACVNDGTGARIVDGSFVMPKMDGTLDDLRLENTERIKDPTCAQKIIETLAHALRCVHGNGFVHLDMHDGNIFYVDNGTCPEVKLGDFDVAVDKSTRLDGFFNDGGYGGSVHRPEWVFSSYTTTEDHEAVDVDWCALLLLANTLEPDGMSGETYRILKEQICKDHGQVPCQLEIRCGLMGVFPEPRNADITFRVGS